MSTPTVRYVPLKFEMRAKAKKPLVVKATLHYETHDGVPRYTLEGPTPWGDSRSLIVAEVEEAQRAAVALAGLLVEAREWYGEWVDRVNALASPRHFSDPL